MTMWNDSATLAQAALPARVPRPPGLVLGGKTRADRGLQSGARRLQRADAHTSTTRQWYFLRYSGRNGPVYN